MANTNNLTKTCSHCGSKTSIFNAKVLARANTTQKAIEIIQYLKQKESNNSHSVTFKKFNV
jgi:hypothetical protein